jgi:hypothetical protein
MPPIVVCHRPGGSIAVEFSGPSGVCTCRECEECQARLAAVRAGQHPAQETLESCHCNHEPALTGTAGSSFRRDDRSGSLLAALVSVPLPAAFADGLQSGLAARPGLLLSSSAGAGGAFLLRC